MSTWPPDELDRLGRAEEVGVASRRPDGTLRGFVTIWAVRVGDAIYIRSAYGFENPWFQRALRSGQGRIRTTSLEQDVTFEPSEPELANDVTAAYHAKYDRHGPRIVGTVVSEEAVRSTLRVMPT
jgi:hypothetical protein